VQFRVFETARTVSAVTIKKPANADVFDCKRILCHGSALIFDQRHFNLLTIASVRRKTLPRSE
jgi:hypothetical protein